MFGAVSPLVGDATIRILEVSGPDASNLEMREGTFTLSKVLPDFYLKNFVATTGEDSTTPTTEFSKGAPIYLTWESNGTYFQLFAKGKPVWQGSNTSVLLPDGVVADTTFVLVASMTGNPDQDSPQGGYEPIYLYEALTVAVLNPVLTPSSLTVTDQTTMNAATVTGALRVNGGSTLNGGVAVNGPLTVEGSTTLNGALTVNGLSGSAGPVALLGAPVRLDYGEAIPLKTVKANTDGFVLLRLVMPPNRNTTYNIFPCDVYGSIIYDGFQFDVQGGAFYDGLQTRRYVGTAVTVPVRAGTCFSYTGSSAVLLATPGAPSPDWNIEVVWFPLGTAPLGVPTVEVLASDDRTDGLSSG